MTKEKSKKLICLTDTFMLLQHNPAIAAPLSCRHGNCCLKNTSWFEYLARNARVSKRGPSCTIPVDNTLLSADILVVCLEGALLV